MYKIITILFLTILTVTNCFSQKYEVPDEIMFAGIELHIDRSGREEIQKYVNQLTLNQTYHQKYVDLANIHFPIIEEVFKEENLPFDFKYLIIQESAFKGDVVSKSNAVGYWQMKEASATEVGLRVDDHVDERKNIVSSSHAAAKYLTKNNDKLRNWVYALLSYYLGPKGVLSEVKSKYLGATTMDIDKNTHWYILKCIAHKIAFENDVKTSNSSTKLIADYNWGGKTIKHAAKKYHLEEEELVPYNFWIDFNKKIPTDKTYAVIIPVKGDFKNENPSYDDDNAPANSYAKIFENPKENIRYVVNGLPAIVAIEGDDLTKLAAKADVSVANFKKYNEFSSDEKIQTGHTYYLHIKKSSALIAFHVVQPGETLHSIAQRYGMRISAILSKNRMKKKEALQDGRVLWMMKKRPSHAKVEIRDVKVQTLPVAKPELKIEEPKPVKVEPKKTEVIKEPKKETTPIVKVEEKIETKAEEPKPKETPIVIQEEKPIVVKEEPKEEPVVENKVQDQLHEVQPGETLYAISRKYNVPVQVLKDWNGLIENSLNVGQKLIVSKAEMIVEEPVIQETKKESIEIEKTEEVFHEVQAGETLFRIYKMYGTDVEQIKKWNNMSDNNLKVGTKIRVK